MSLQSYYKDHWVEIEPERLDRYEQQFVLRDVHRWLLEPADIRPGQTVADFGCGPGYISVELAERVGAQGHVHALDVNRDFLDRTAQRGRAQGLQSRISTHLLEGTRLPLDDACVDRVFTKNVMIYVDDPAGTFAEFRRIVRPGGKVHAIDSDFWTAAVDPVPAQDWRAFIDAASVAFRTPTIGRQMYRLAREAGFSQVQVEVVARPDTQGHLMHFIRNAAGYARLAGTLSDDRVEAVVRCAQEALDNGRFFALNPQYMVTAVA
ncbi:MAG: methyltransferase domain-containing protein [Gammaproteobacteria bacterium]|nr:methyltransferase domain-containing protein [Gammaproteobacteria bacterium]